MLSGVDDVQISLASGEVTVVFDPARVSPAQIQNTRHPPPASWHRRGSTRHSAAMIPGWTIVDDSRKARRHSNNVVAETMLDDATAYVG